MNAFASPRSFAWGCMRLAAALAIAGAAGLVDRLFVLSLAALIAVFAGLALLTESDRFDHHDLFDDDPFDDDIVFSVDSKGVAVGLPTGTGSHPVPPRSLPNPKGPLSWASESASS